MAAENTKHALRQAARQKRDALAEQTPGAGDRMAEHARRILDLSPVAGPVVSGYLAIGSELDPAMIMVRLTELGLVTALPVMKNKGTPLEFRAWKPGAPLVDRMWGIREPGAECPVVEPDILLVPLLLVDRDGNRLGYGGGFYDRTLNRLRQSKKTVAIGVAYPSQRVDAVPHEDYDERLDYLLTPLGLEKF
jgi:5-formyltetrahydrofolate cyclo-ligase